MEMKKTTKQKPTNPTAPKPKPAPKGFVREDVYNSLRESLDSRDRRIEELFMQNKQLESALNGQQEQQAMSDSRNIASSANWQVASGQSEVVILALKLEETNGQLKQAFSWIAHHTEKAQEYTREAGRLGKLRDGLKETLDATVK